MLLNFGQCTELYATNFYETFKVANKIIV